MSPAVSPGNNSDLLRHELPETCGSSPQHTPGTPVTPDSPVNSIGRQESGSCRPVKPVPLPLIGVAGVASDPNVRFRPSDEDASDVQPALFPDIIGHDEPVDETVNCTEQMHVENDVTSSLESIEPPAKAPSAFLAVYDGHGGAAVAQSAASELHSKFASHLSHLRNAAVTPRSCVSRAFVKAYAELDAELRSARMFQTGSTAVTCYVHSDETGRRKILTTANVGDARAVLCRGGDAIRLSCDHRACDDDERARIERAGGFVCARRVNGILEVSRALGDHAFKSVVVCTPSIRETVLCEADEFLVLACDGLWDWVDDDTAVKIASNAFDDGCNPAEVARILVQAALSAGSTDNVTVLVTRFDI